MRNEPFSARGCMPHRRRETAILGQQLCIWKLLNFGINHATDVTGIIDASRIPTSPSRNDAQAS
eukprot:7348065-Pyramimonas_sp.AAC.1